MPSLRLCAFLFGALLLASPLPGQDGKKKDEVRKDDAAAKFKGQLPANWKKLGLTDDQTQRVYKVQAKYNEQIDALEERIREMKGKMTKERYEVLTTEQRKRLDELNKAKAGG